jgi:hypothetical protein
VQKNVRRIGYIAKHIARKDVRATENIVYHIYVRNSVSIQVEELDGLAHRAL